MHTSRDLRPEHILDVAARPLGWLVPAPFDVPSLPCPACGRPAVVVLRIRTAFHVVRLMPAKGMQAIDYCTWSGDAWRGGGDERRRNLETQFWHAFLQSPAVAD